MPGASPSATHSARHDDIVAVVLAAGAGRRLRPLSDVRPKALCPVNNVALVDHALARAETVANDIAVNVHHGRELMEQHLAGRAHLSVEEPDALGTAGALGLLRSWIDGRPVLVLNSDVWPRYHLSELVEGWDRARTRLLMVEGADGRGFGPLTYAGAALMPWSAVAALEPMPSGLYEVSWRPLAAAGSQVATGRRSRRSSRSGSRRRRGTPGRRGRACSSRRRNRDRPVRRALFHR